MKWVIPVSAAVVCAALIAGCDTSRNGPTSHATRPSDEPAANREPAFRISATALAQEAIADPKAAVAKYQGQLVEVEGRIDLANRVIGDSRMVSLVGARKGPDNSISVDVMCLAVAGFREQMWWLGKGQKVKAIGRVTNISPAAVYLDECTFTEQEPNPTARSTAEQLAGEFTQDAATAAKKYQPVIGEKSGKEVIITGTVAGLIQTRDGLTIAQLAGAARETVNCQLKKEEWQSLKRGDVVTIKGDYAKFDAQQNAVIINNAFLLKKD